MVNMCPSIKEKQLQDLVYMMTDEVLMVSFVSTGVCDQAHRGSEYNAICVLNCTFDIKKYINRSEN